MKKIIWIIIIVVVLGGLGFYFSGSDSYQEETIPQPPALPE